MQTDGQLCFAIATGLEQVMEEAYFRAFAALAGSGLSGSVVLVIGSGARYASLGRLPPIGGSATIELYLFR